MNLITCGSAILSQYELEIGSQPSIEFTFTDPTGPSDTYFIDIGEVTRMINKTIKSFPRVFIKNRLEFYGSITKIMGGTVVYMFDTDKEPMCYFHYDDMVKLVSGNIKSLTLYKLVL